MPKLIQAEARALVCVRRLLLLLREFMPEPQETSVLSLILKEIRHMSDTFATEMEQLRADVAAQGSVIASATAAFRGLAMQLLTAEAAAKNAGATDAQVAGLTSLRQSLESNTSVLANAIPANTPVVPQTPATPAPAPIPTEPAPASTSVPASAPVASAPGATDAGVAVPVQA